MADGANIFVTDVMPAYAAAETKLAQALSSVPDHARAHMNLGLIKVLTKRATEGIAECEHALELDRNLAHAHSNIAFGKIFMGRAEETETHILEALHLSPRDKNAYIWQTVRKLDLSGFLRGVGDVRIAHGSHRRIRTRPASVVAGGG